MFNLLKRDICPIGVDIGTHAVRMLQLRHHGGQYALQAACRIEMEPAAGSANAASRISGAIQQGLSSQPFTGKAAVLSLPPAAVHAKSVRLPQMPDSDLRQALQWEAKDRFGFDVVEGRVAWFRAGEVRRGTEVKDELLLFAAKSEDLALHLDAAANAKLRVSGIDLAPCAAYRSMLYGGFQQPPAGDSLSLLDIGCSASQFVITRNEQMIFFKQIEIGAHAIDGAIAQKLGITPAEASQMRGTLNVNDPSSESAAPLAQAVQDAMRPPLEELARELDMCMRYFAVTFRGTRPDLIAVTGRHADCSRILETLSAALGLRAEPARPLRGVADLGDVARPDRSSEWSIAAGLSMYPVESALEAAA